VEYVRITAVIVEHTLVLASNSPRRRELLALSGCKFTVRPADVDEGLLPGETPGAYVLRLSENKARACVSTSRPDELILAADTAVAIDGRILGKPRDQADAADMLHQLRGRMHQVYTGIAIGRDKLLGTDLCTTSVPMRSYTDDEINAYIATGDPLDKAGAYAIQHPGFHPVDHLNGCYASVMGLPLCHMLRLLRQAGFAPPADIPAGCQAHLHYACPISAAVLHGEVVG
jgi:MAF protein